MDRAMMEMAMIVASPTKPGRPATHGGGGRWKDFYIILFQMKSSTFIVHLAYSPSARKDSLLWIRGRIDIIGARHVFCPSPRLGLSGIPGSRNGYGFFVFLSSTFINFFCCLAIDTFAALAAINYLLPQFKN